MSSGFIPGPQYSFTFKGIASSTMGVYVTEKPTIPTPAPRVSFKTVPGRSGSLAVLEGDNIYDDMLLTIQCTMDFPDSNYDGDSDNKGIAEIMEWLSGEGELRLPQRQSGFYKARVVNQISFRQILRGNSRVSFAINYRLRPFFYLNTSTVSIGTLRTTFNGYGTLDAYPLITAVRTAAAGTITINGATISLPADPTLSTIYIDCESKVAYNDDGENLTNIVGGEWPVLKPTVNTAQRSYAFSSVTLTTNWRSL